MPAVIEKKHSIFLAKIVTLLKAVVWVIWWYRFFCSAFGSCKIKGYCYKMLRFRDHASRIWLPDYSRLAINRKCNNDISICQEDVINFLDVSLFLLSCLVTGPSFMSISIFIYKELTRNPEIINTSIWVLPNIWRLGQVKDNKFGTSVSNKMLLNAAKPQGNKQLLSFSSY